MAQRQGGCCWVPRDKVMYALMTKSLTIPPCHENIRTILTKGYKIVKMGFETTLLTSTNDTTCACLTFRVWQRRTNSAVTLTTEERALSSPSRSLWPETQVAAWKEGAQTTQRIGLVKFVWIKDSKCLESPHHKACRTFYIYQHQTSRRGDLSVFLLWLFPKHKSKCISEM